MDSPCERIRSSLPSPSKSTTAPPGMTQFQHVKVSFNTSFLMGSYPPSTGSMNVFISISTLTCLQRPSAVSPSASSITEAVPVSEAKSFITHSTFPLTELKSSASEPQMGVTYKGITFPCLGGIVVSGLDWELGDPGFKCPRHQKLTGFLSFAFLK